MQEHSLFSISSPAILTSVRWLTSHCSFDLHFSNNERCWASFHVFISHISVSLEKCPLGLFPTFWLGCLFFWYWVVWAACIFWKLILCQLFHLLLFSPVWGLSFTLLIVSFAVQKLLSFIRSHLSTFVFISFHYSRRWIIEDPALIYVIKCSAYVFL